MSPPENVHHGQNPIRKSRTETREPTMHESLHHLREILNTLTEMETVSSRRIEEMTSKVESMTEELAGLRSRVEELSNRTSHYPLPHDMLSGGFF